MKTADLDLRVITSINNIYQEGIDDGNPADEQQQETISYQDVYETVACCSWDGCDAYGCCPKD